MHHTKRSSGVRVVRTAATVGAITLAAASVLCPPAALALMPGWLVLGIVSAVTAMREELGASVAGEHINCEDCPDCVAAGFCRDSQAESPSPGPAAATAVQDLPPSSPPAGEDLAAGVPSSAPDEHQPSGESSPPEDLANSDEHLKRSTT